MDIWEADISKLYIYLFLGNVILILKYRLYISLIPLGAYALGSVTWNIPIDKTIMVHVMIWGLSQYDVILPL